MPNKKEGYEGYKTKGTKHRGSFSTSWESRSTTLTIKCKKAIKT